LTSQIPSIIKTGVSLEDSQLASLINDKFKQVNLPVYSPDTQERNWYNDRFDSKIIWYLPSFVLLDDPDGSFKFEASQSIIPDTNGQPFNTCRLTFGLRKMVPSNIDLDRITLPLFDYREIPISNLSISLETRAKDPDTGTEVVLPIPCSITPKGETNWELSKENILGKDVVILYQNLKESGAKLSISYTFEVWKEIPQSGQPFKIFTGSLSLAHNTPSTTLTNFVALPNNVSVSADTLSFIALQNIGINPQTNEVVIEIVDTRDEGSGSLFESTSLPLSVNIPISTKFAADPYRKKFIINLGGISRAILGPEDLKNFNAKQSEFAELKLLGNVNQKYPSIGRLYWGILSRSIIVIPTRYVILRQIQSCAAVCNALVDSSPGLESGCKIQFRFTLIPDVSPIDLIQLEQDIKDHDEIKDCNLAFPQLIKSSSSTLATPFDSKSEYLAGSLEKDSFLLTTEITETAAGTPAVANANMFIKQLSSTNEPFLSGIIDIKLDDIFPEPIQVPVLLNFKETNGASGIIFHTDADSKKCVLSNMSSFDLNIKRVALITSEKKTILEIGTKLLAGQNTTILLDDNHAVLDKLLIDSQLSIADTILKSDILKYLRFETVDVQRTQYLLGVNGSTINFDFHKIKKITIQIIMTDIPNIAIPSLTLSNERTFDSTRILLPLGNAMGVLNASLLNTIEFTDDASKPPITKTLQNDFVEHPIFMLNAVDIGI
jgi:hypothetical protein